MVSKVLPDFKSFYRALLLALLFYFVFLKELFEILFSQVSSFSWHLCFILFLLLFNFQGPFPSAFFAAGILFYHFFSGLSSLFRKKIIFSYFFFAFSGFSLPSLRDSPNIILLFFPFVKSVSDFFGFFRDFYFTAIFYGNVLHRRSSFSPPGLLSIPWLAPFLFERRSRETLVKIVLVSNSFL